MTRLARPLRGGLAVLGLVLGSCQASTTRPTFSPTPTALSAQLHLDPPEAFEAILEAFRADSIPMARVEARDRWFDSGWLQSPGLEPAVARPVGPAFVRVRGWVDLGKPNHSRYAVETVYRPFLDPSRDDRELEAAVPDTHPASVRVRRVLSGVLRVHGDPEDRQADSVATAWLELRLRPPPAPRDSLPGRPDTTASAGR